MKPHTLPVVGAMALFAVGCTDSSSTAPAAIAGNPPFLAGTGPGPTVIARGSGPSPMPATAARLSWDVVALSTLGLTSAGATRNQSPGAPTSPYLVWTNTSTGERVLWEMDATAYNGRQTSFGVGTTWQIVGTGDFSCDGKPDLLWRNSSTGENVVWYMNGPTYSGQQAALSGVNTQWQVGAVADFNGDNMPDIVWQNGVTGERAIWQMSCFAYVSQTSLGTVSTDWKIVAAANFVGDAGPDLVWQNTVTGERVIWQMTGAAYQGSQASYVVGGIWDIAGTADFNADGRPDIVWQNSITGERAIWHMNGFAYTGQTQIGTVGPTWDISAILALPGPAPLTPTVGIVSITQPNGSGQQVPVNLGAASGALTVTLNVDPRGQTLRSVSATITCPSGTTTTATQTYSAPLVGFAVLTLDAAAFDTNTGIGTLRNGACSIVGSAVTGPVQVPITGTSSALSFALANSDGLVVTNTFTPYTNAQGVSTITSATDANGFVWRGGSVTVRAMPVSYTASPPAVASVDITLPGATIPTQTITSSPFTATWSATATSGPSVNGIMLYDALQPEPGTTTPKGIAPAITARNAGGGLLSLPVVGASGATFRLDNTAPQPPVTFMTPRRQSFENTTASTVFAFVNASYVFSGSGTAGGIGAKGTMNYVACGDGEALPPSNPPACGTQSGVSMGAVSATTGTNGRTTIAYYARPTASYTGPPTAGTGTAASLAACNLTGWTKINTGNDLAEVQFDGQAYVARLFETDALGNARCTDLGWRQNVINSGVFIVGTFGIDKYPPVAMYSIDPQFPSMADHEIVAAGGAVGSLYIAAIDQTSGFVQKPVQTKIERLAIQSGTGAAGLPNTPFSCPSGVVNGLCAATATSIVIPGNADFITDANGVLYRTTADNDGCAGCGYWTFTQTLFDVAQNSAPTLTRTILIDTQLPSSGGVFPIGTMIGGTNATMQGIGTDNLEIIAAQLTLRYAVTPAYGASAFAARWPKQTLGVAFDNVIDRYSSHVLQLPTLLRSLAATTVAGQPLSTSAPLSQVDHRVFDAANNVSAPSSVALTAANVPQTNMTDYGATQAGSGGTFQAFTISNAAASISNCAPTGCVGGTPPVNPTSVNVTATVTGANGVSAFLNPFTLVQFYYLDPTVNEWIYINAVSGATPSTPSANTRAYTFMLLAFDPPTSLGAGTPLRLVGIGLNAAGDGLITPVNSNITLTNP